MALSDISVRSNGQRILASWFNDIRTQLIAVFGATTDETQQTINDNQSSGSNITGLVWDSSSYVGAVVHYTIVRGSQREIGTLKAFYRSGGWDIAREGSGDDCGVTFTINSSTGQIQYTSTSTGTAGKIRHKVTSTFSLES